VAGLRSPLSVSVELAQLRGEVERLRAAVELVLGRLPAPAEVLSTEEVRSMYGISKSVLYELSSRGVLTRVKRQGRRGSWWRRAEIEDYLRGIPEENENRGRRSIRRGPARADDDGRHTSGTDAPGETAGAMIEHSHKQIAMDGPPAGRGFHRGEEG